MDKISITDFLDAFGVEYHTDDTNDKVVHVDDFHVHITSGEGALLLEGPQIEEFLNDLSEALTADDLLLDDELEDDVEELGQGETLK